MRKAGFVIFFSAVILLSTASGSAGVDVMVEVTGFVEFNLVNFGKFAAVNPGDPVRVTFLVNSDVFLDSMSFPTRGYAIDPSSFSLAIASIDADLQDPYPSGGTPYFVLRDNDPAVDGFFFGDNNVDFPFPGLPLDEPGIFGPFASHFRATYVGDTFISLDILDALGTYDFDGLTVFGFSVDDGPFSAIDIVFEQITLTAVNVDDDGDGIPNDEDLCPDTTVPESVPSIALGKNRWALVDGDGVFDTNAPNGRGPGFMFDLEDTAGCSCEQIIEALEVGQGHVRFGCSSSVMEEWLLYVSQAPYTQGRRVVKAKAPRASKGEADRITSTDRLRQNP